MAGSPRCGQDAGYAAKMAPEQQHAQIFQFEFEPRYRWAARPFGLAGHCFIELTDQEFVARFGPWCVRTARANITACAISGPFGFLRTAGPAHLSLADRGLNLTVTPADPTALARALKFR